MIINKTFMSNEAMKSLWNKGRTRLFSAFSPPDPIFESDYMGPNQPMPKGFVNLDPRSFDYEVGENLKTEQYIGRSGITFQHLRAFSNNCEGLRGVIENRKNQISTQKLDYQLKFTEGMSPTQVKEATLKSESIKKARKLFKKPDGEHGFKSWLRMIVEEICVIDHLCILPVRNLKGDIFQFRLIDGDTILKRIDKNGNRPLGNSIAYQQKIKGVIVNDFTASDLFVYGRNPTVNRVYCTSPVEMLVHTINVALRRSTFQLNYYTEGNIPDMLLRVTAKDMDDEKVARFQRYFDLLLTGDLKRRRRVRFIPETADPIYPQQDVLKDEFDEWLMRIITYFFGSSPNHFVRNLNRAVSESQYEQSNEEGLTSYKETLKEIIDELLEIAGLDDIEAVWVPTRAQNSEIQAKTDKIRVEAGLESIDEIRDRDGLAPIGIGNTVRTAHGLVDITGQGKNYLATIYTDIDKTNDPDKEEGATNNENSLKNKPLHRETT